jgi:site-specific DNA-methyltransferase (adenine-specific)
MNDRISKPYYTHEGSIVIHGDSLDELKKLPDNSIDAVVTDPPYGLGNTSASNVADCLKAWANGNEWMPKGSGFMNKAWDAWVPPPALWAEVYRVLKHGGHALVFAGSRTQDLMSISMRLAGFELRDMLMWLYSSGFPKSHDVSKAINKKLGAEREVISIEKRYNEPNGLVKIGQGERKKIERKITAPATEQAKAWQGWGTALKPAYEPIILARKPLAGTVADNVLTHGVGGLNIDGCRIETNRDLGRANKIDDGMFSVGHGLNKQAQRKQQGLEAQGLWPANILLDNALQDPLIKRYFYCAKPSPAERQAGVKDTELHKNIHPTVKPITLMRYLCRLITPKGGTILEPFAGSGTTLIASHLEGFKHIGIEREEDYVKIIRARLKHWAGIRDTSETKKASAKGQLELFG